MNEIVNRATSKTPKFFKKLRNVSTVLAGIGLALATAPIGLPAVIVTIGAYFTVAGGVAAAISQLTVEDSEKKK